MHFLLLLQIPLQTQRPNCADHNREVGLGPNEGKIDDVLGPSLVKQEQEEEELLIRSWKFERSHPASTHSTCAQQTNCRESVITDRLDMSNNRSAIWTETLDVYGLVAKSVQGGARAQVWSRVAAVFRLCSEGGGPALAMPPPTQPPNSKLLTSTCCGSRAESQAHKIYIFLSLYFHYQQVGQNKNMYLSFLWVTETLWI